MKEQNDIFFIEYVSLSSYYGVGTYSKVLLDNLCNIKGNNHVNLVKVGFAKQGSVKTYMSANNTFKIIEILFRSDNAEFKEQIDFKISNIMAAACIKVIMQHKTGTGKPILHVNSPLQYEIATLAKEFNCLLVYTQHLSIWRISYGNNLLSFQKDIAAGLLKDNLKKEIGLCNLCDGVICLNRESENIILDLYKINKEKISLIYNGIGGNTFKKAKLSRASIREKYGFRQDDFIIVFIGRLHRDKGIYDLIEIFKQLSEKYKKLRLVIAGGGEIKEVTQNCQEVCGRVSVLGFAGSDIINEIYKIADVGVLPSYHEQSSFTVLEMISNHLPIIVTDTAGFEIFDDHVHLLKIKVLCDKEGFPAIDQLCFLNNLTLLYKDALLRKKMSRNAFNLLKTKYSGMEMADKTMQIYKNISN